MNKINKNLELMTNTASESKDMKKGKQPKGRPSMQPEEQKLKDSNVMVKYGAEYRSIELWNNKLENMLTILTADSELELLGKPLDEFQSAF